MHTAVVSKWGNSQALRIPAEILHRLNLKINDKVILSVQEDRLTVTKAAAPVPGTIEYLFKDYTAEPFNTELINPDTPVGNEKW